MRTHIVVEANKKIPKIIHYCWFGGKPIPNHNRKIMESWKKFCPDYEIKEWNEFNYDFTKNCYMKEAFEHKQWAFVSDYARLDIIYEHGGIYLDTDVELLKPLNDLLSLKGFVGFDHAGACNTGGGFGAIPKLPIIKELRDYYDTLIFNSTDGTLNDTTNTVCQTNYLLTKGLIQNDSLQEIEGLTIFPKEYFCPMDWLGITNLTQNSYSIHHFDASWLYNQKYEGVSLIRRSNLEKWGVVLTPKEETIYDAILKDEISIKTLKDLISNINLILTIFSAGNKLYKDKELYETSRKYLNCFAEKGIQNKVTSLKLYFTTFREWKIFETPRANLRYIYHCLRNLLHV